MKKEQEQYLRKSINDLDLAANEFQNAVDDAEIDASENNTLYTLDTLIHEINTEITDFQEEMGWLDDNKD